MPVRRLIAGWNSVSGTIKPAFDTAKTGARLRTGLCHFALPVDVSSLAEGLTVYLAELSKWNKAYNLTAVRDPHDMVPRHLYDSLSALPYISGAQIADVGTGAGLPGIPMALCCPDKQFTLLDSNGKKIRFVQHMITVLELRNVIAEQVRVEKYQPAVAFDTVISRAFASLADFVAGCAHLVTTGGRLVAMKGRFPEQELAALTGLQPDWCLSGNYPVEVPEQQGARHVLVFERTGTD